MLHYVYHFNKYRYDMPKTTVDDLIQKREQINARIQKIRARENVTKRKYDTTAKVLLGAALLLRLEENDEKAQELLRWCRSVLSDRDKERLDKALQNRK